MKKQLFLGLSFLFLSGSIIAKTIEEPEFVGESILVRSDNTTTPLEKQLTQGRAVASTGLLLTGIGKVRQQIQIDGCCSNVKVRKNEDIKIIVRNRDNLSDPLSIIKIFKFDTKKKFRRAELASYSSLGSAKSNNMNYVSFTGKKFGTSSYILSLSSLPPGEYGITALNPNAIDEKQTVISTFAVTE